MQVAIIDDLAVCRQDIKEYLLRYIRENYQGEEPELDEFESGTRFLDAFRPQVYDVIFIDQYMEGMSGMDTAREIRNWMRRLPLFLLPPAVTMQWTAMGSEPAVI